MDRELPPRTLAHFEAHLRGCRRCAGEVSERRRLKQAMGTLPAVAAPRSFRITADTAMNATARPPAAQPLRLALRLSMALGGLAIIGLASTVAIDLSGRGNSTPAAAPSTLQASSAAEDARRPALGQSAAPLAPTSQGLPTTRIASGAPPPETASPSPDSGRKAVATDMQAPSTGDRRVFRLVEVGFALIAGASVAASVVMVRKQRRTIP